LQTQCTNSPMLTKDRDDFISAVTRCCGLLRAQKCLYQSADSLLVKSSGHVATNGHEVGWDCEHKAFPSRGPGFVNMVDELSNHLAK